MIIASSMTLLADSRTGHTGGLLPWALLTAGSTASLAANVAVAEPTVYGRVIAAWPSFALIGAYELLMRQVRQMAAAAAAGPARKPATDGDNGTTRPPEADTARRTMLSAPAWSAATGSGRFTGPDRSGGRRGARRLDADILTRARQVDAEHRARSGRPASAETLRLQLRVGAASARQLQYIIRKAPADPTKVTFAR
jgi:hypothetical protein